jgi:hypothetical protein
VLQAARLAPATVVAHLERSAIAETTFSIVITPTMVSRLCLALLLLSPFVSFVSAGPPERLSGALLQLRGVGFRGGTVGDVEQTYPYALFEDGTFLGLYNRESGRWSYGKIDAEVAVVTRTEAADTIRDTLVFTGDTSGTWSRPFSSLDRNLTFVLYPFGGRSRLVNSSSRAYVRPGERTTIGFVVAQSGTMILVRAVGPGLRPFGVTGALATTALAVRNASGAVLFQNAGWSTPDVVRPGLARSPSEADRIRGLSVFFGAFALSPGSADSAVHWIADAGNYVAEVSPTDSSTSGEVLIEVYAFP